MNISQLSLETKNLLKVINCDEIIHKWLVQFNIDISHELENISQIQLYSCPKTKINFFVPEQTIGSSRLYEQLEKFDWYYMEQKWEHDIAIKDLSECQKVLEVGCGKGYFIKRLSEEMNIEAWGIDTNLNAIQYAKSQNINVVNADLKNIAQDKQNYFDGIASFQVLEHIADFHDFLESLVKIVKSGGRLIISVPNSNAFTKYDNNNLLDQPPHHMTQWCEESFIYLTSILPIKIKRVLFEPLADYHIDWYINVQVSRVPKTFKLQGIIRRLLNWSLKPILQKFPITRNLIHGHTLYVCFEKQ